MEPMFKQIREQLNKLERTEIQIIPKGTYPDKRTTKVSDVAHYQNDGTSRGIKPSRFVERAAIAENEWHQRMRIEVGKYLDGDENSLSRVGFIIARDIMKKIDRIKTGRLLGSMIHRVKR